MNYTIADSPVFATLSDLFRFNFVAPVVLLSFLAAITYRLFKGGKS